MSRPLATRSLEVQKGWEVSTQNPAALCLVTATACAVARQFGAPDLLAIPAAVALMLFALLQWGGISFTYRVFSVAAPTIAASLWFLGSIDTHTIVAGVDRAAFFTFFLTSLAVLRESAKSSVMVRKAGKALVNQPPARRYMLLSFGSHLFSVMLNIGALNVLGVMVQRAVRTFGSAEERRLAGIKQRRMLTATLRGFCAVPLWAPTSVTMLLVLSSLPQLSWEEYAPFGLTWTVLFILFGGLLDWFAYPRVKRFNYQHSSLWVLVPFLALVCVIPLSAYLLSQITGLGLFPMLLMCAPLIGVVWIWYQFRGKKPGLRFRLLGRRMMRSFPKTFTAQRNEVVLFASSGFLGVILIPLVDPQVASDLLRAANIGTATTLMGISLTMLICSLVGINAIITVTLLLGVLQQIPDLNIPAIAQASVVALTWAVFAGGSPFTASLRIMASFSGVTPARMGILWNGWFSLGVLVLMYATLYLVF